ncbi:hypothetical protein ACTXM3_13530 [Glutamicibacter arilaitensis]|uniref:hypothetical protein n=1 Tax=Glutamicibacter arilaitensis TaxID=256701 RepID=UPI003FD082AB
MFEWLSSRAVRKNLGYVHQWDKEFVYGVIHASNLPIAADHVHLYINDVCLMDFPLSDAGDGIRSFKIGMFDVWRFASKSDKITVRFRDHELPFPNGRSFLTPEQNGKENLLKLSERFSAGQYFDQRGRIVSNPLSKDRDHEWQDGVMNLYAEVDAVIRKVTGAASFIFSGTLLGYVRDSGFIPHDKDMDCAYLSGKETATEVITEFVALADALIDAGFSVTPKASCIAVRRAPGSNIMVDIAHLFIKPDGYVGFPFGRVGIEDVSTRIFSPLGSGMLSGFPVTIPANTEALVEHIYGPEWRTPDPEFKWGERRRSRDPQPLLNYSQRTRIAMEDLYSRTLTSEPSPFVRWVVGTTAAIHFAVAYDLGCGNGRDLVTLGKVAEHVVGVERNSRAVAVAKKFTNGAPQISVHHADFLESEWFSESLAQEFNGPRLFYARFLLNGMTESEQALLLRSLQVILNSGDHVVFEHRTSQDDGLKKEYFRSYRRFVDTDKFIQDLQQAGLTVLTRDEGQGLAHFGREDPHVVRLVAVLSETVS